ncbi:unnamed protein product [Danaus chrysippus]|uniref:(African queen) hypothetical protein n=1 Tax=Danaus chrysippus TaxID=151541 RepID=A0A8J2QCP2_9NEOP|nr:unnamed protein product [Danaus chrysippus]
MAVETHLVGTNENKMVKKSKRKSRISAWCHLHWRKIFAEMVSTLLLLLFGCMTCIPIDHNHFNLVMRGSIGFGIIVIFNIQTFGHISGAHMNPVVSVAAAIWGHLSIELALAYCIAQCVGAILGYGMLVALSSEEVAAGVCVNHPNSRYAISQVLGTEIFITSALLFITCSVWDPINEKHLESASIKIGLTIAGLSIAGAPITGASMNPVRSFAPAIWNNNWEAHWVYWVGPFVGGILTALLYKYAWLKRVDEIRSTEVITWSEEVEGEV